MIRKDAGRGALPRDRRCTSEHGAPGPWSRKCTEPAWDMAQKEASRRAYPDRAAARATTNLHRAAARPVLETLESCLSGGALLFRATSTNTSRKKQLASQQPLFRRATPVARERAPTGVFADHAEARIVSAKWANGRATSDAQERITTGAPL